MFCNCQLTYFKFLFHYNQMLHSLKQQHILYNQFLCSDCQKSSSYPMLLPRVYTSIICIKKSTRICFLIIYNQEEYLITDIWLFRKDKKLFAVSFLIDIFFINFFSKFCWYWRFNKLRSKRISHWISSNQGIFITTIFVLSDEKNLGSI